MHFAEMRARFERQMAAYAADTGRRIRDARERNRPGLSQEDIAHELGVTAKTVGRWERGESEPRGKQWKPLAEALRVEVDALRGKPPIAPEQELRDQLHRIEGKLDRLTGNVDRLLAVLGLEEEDAELNDAVEAFARALEARAAAGEGERAAG